MWIKLLFKTIGEVIIDLINDLKSTRNQLLWMATWLFCWCVGRGVETSVLLTVAGLNTIVYTFYFQAKNNEANHQHEKDILDIKGLSPSKGVNPDEVPDN